MPGGTSAVGHACSRNGETRPQPRGIRVVGQRAGAARPRIGAEPSFEAVRPTDDGTPGHAIERSYRPHRRHRSDAPHSDSGLIHRLRIASRPPRVLASQHPVEPFLEPLQVTELAGDHLPPHDVAVHLIEHLLGDAHAHLVQHRLVLLCHG